MVHFLAALYHEAKDIIFNNYKVYGLDRDFFKTDLEHINSKRRNYTN